MHGQGQEQEEAAYDQLAQQNAGKILYYTAPLSPSSKPATEFRSNGYIYAVAWLAQPLGESRLAKDRSPSIHFYGKIQGRPGKGRTLNTFSDTVSTLNWTDSVWRRRYFYLDVFSNYDDVFNKVQAGNFAYGFNKLMPEYKGGPKPYELLIELSNVDMAGNQTLVASGSFLFWYDTADRRRINERLDLVRSKKF